jgi:hypothetical protein
MALGGSLNNQGCSDSEDYIPDEYTSTIYIKCNFHFIYNNESDPRNFTATWDGISTDNTYQGVPMNGNIWIERTVQNMNSLLENNEMMNVPPGFPGNEVLDYKIRIINSGVYYHPGGDFFDACLGSFSQLLDSFSVNLDSEINIFFY